MACGAGHESPSDMFYDFKKDRFWLRPEDLVSNDDANYDASKYPHPVPKSMNNKEYMQRVLII